MQQIICSRCSDSDNCYFPPGDEVAAAGAAGAAGAGAASAVSGRWVQPKALHLLNRAPPFRDDTVPVLTHTRARCGNRRAQCYEFLSQSDTLQHNKNYGAGTEADLQAAASLAESAEDASAQSNTGGQVLSLNYIHTHTHTILYIYIYIYIITQSSYLYYCHGNEASKCVYNK